jgi:hypothetical protein
MRQSARANRLTARPATPFRCPQLSLLSRQVVESALRPPPELLEQLAAAGDAAAVSPPVPTRGAPVAAAAGPAGLPVAPLPTVAAAAVDVPQAGPLPAPED